MFCPLQFLVRVRAKYGMRQLFERMIQQIPNLTEAQVLDQLRALKAVRDNFGETLSFLNSASLPVSEDREDEITELRSELNSTSRPEDSVRQLSDYLEDALKKQLQRVRKTGS
jgi:hypothetical protein